MKKPGKVITMFVILIILVIVAVFVAVYAINKSNEENETETVTSTSQSQNEEVGTSQNKEKKEEKAVEYSTDIEVVPTLLDEISTNSAWCATFQLIWNDMQNEVVGQDIVFNPQITMVENLNQQSFTEDDISEEYYYKTYGLKTLSLKKEIEENIKEKFNQSSDVLDLIDWSDASEDDLEYNYQDYIFYAMLYREFNFEEDFTELYNNNFYGTEFTYENIEYFGIDSSSSDDLYSQVDVLYYNSDEDFAVILNTEEGDQVILCKGENGNTFEEIWNEINEKSLEYEGNKEFTENDFLQVPNINMDILKNFDELTGENFETVNGDFCKIEAAFQTIKFSLDESGGKIKSEALMEVDALDVIDEEPEIVEWRYFYFDSTFTMFLREEGQELPYFAANIDDITLYQ